MGHRGVRERRKRIEWDTEGMKERVQSGTQRVERNNRNETEWDTER